ncbi:MAG: glycosyltransferase family 4 protein [Actinobacteria bacterium]|nr:glycosyltransferase family 4 protein [Actinomycetota bacterium]MBW3641986.1 glycosyltransferase family 4 protein [Actinomycetota bacterium]
MAERLRVGYLSGSPVVGGTERYLRELARSLDGRGVEPVILRRPALGPLFADGGGGGIAQVDISAWEPGSRVPDRWSAAGWPSSTATTSPANLAHLRSAVVPLVKQLATEIDRPRLERVLARLGLALLHVHNGGHPGSPSALAAMLAAGRLGIPTVLTVHGVAKPRGLLHRAEERLDRRVAGSASVVTTVGEAPARALADLRGFDPTSIRVIPTGIPDPAAPAARRQARAAFGLDEDVPVVGSIAAFVPVKGHVGLLESLAQARRSVPDLHAVLAGEGPSRRQVAERAEALGLAGVAHLPGSVDPFATLAGFDVFVSASTTEGLPLSVLEAMSQGLPVVATAVGAVPEAVVDGETGFLVAPGDVDGLAQRVVEVLADPVLARRLGEAGRRRFEARHRLDDMVAAFQGLYHEVLRQPQ